MMSVAALTMDEQRLNNYNAKTGNPANSAGFISGPASPEPPQQYHQEHHHKHQQQEEQTFSVAEKRMLEAEIESLKDEQARLLQQVTDSQRREKILTRRLANKEQEFQDYVSQIAEYKAAQAPSAVALRTALLDPAVNILFEKLKKELKATKAKLEETQNELSAWKFTPDSNTGKRLMAKCRLLYQENEELGKMTSSGRLAKLETELAMQKSFSEEVKKSQSELDDFLQELDEDVEGMQSTILFLQQELKTTRERIQTLEKENYQLKNGNEEETVNKDNENEIDDQNTPTHQNTGGLNGDVLSVTVKTATTTATIGSHNNTNSDINSQQNDLRFQNTAMKLTPIKEEPCVRVAAYTCGNSKDDTYYNGNNNVNDSSSPNHLHPSQYESGLTNDRTLRPTVTTTTPTPTTAAITRKRTYDSIEINETLNTAVVDNATTITTSTSMSASTLVTHPPLHTIAQVVAPPVPRTLPPKKSKLRMTPPTIEQDSLLEQKENEKVINNTTTLSNPLAMEPITIDNAVLNMASNEENPTNIDEHAATGNNGNGNGSTPQRIMTRRRSMRTQQNGA